MTDKERVGLALAMCKEFWAYYADAESIDSARAFLACMEIVLEYGGENNAAD